MCVAVVVSLALVSSAVCAIAVMAAAMLSGWCDEAEEEALRRKMCGGKN